MHLHTRPLDMLLDDLAHEFMADALDAVRSRGLFHIALSGGSTPEPFYVRLVTDPRYRNIPWERTHVWLADERRVPPDDDRANIRMIRETLTDVVPIPASQVHAVPVHMADPADAYEAELRKHVRDTSGRPGTGGEDPPRLDLVLLGMGDDCHTASLFPGSAALQVRDQLVANNDGPGVTPPPRVTLTYPMINAAWRVAVLVTGFKKAAPVADAVAAIRGGGRNIETMPITGVAPTSGELLWFVDDEAAGGLEGSSGAILAA